MANRFHTGGVDEGAEVFTDVVVLGGLVGLSWAIGLVIAAVRGAPVATAGAETVTAAAIEVTAVTAASTRRVVGEWRDFTPIAFHRGVV